MVTQMADNILSATSSGLVMVLKEGAAKLMLRASHVHKEVDG